MHLLPGRSRRIMRGGTQVDRALQEQWQIRNQLYISHAVVVEGMLQALRTHLDWPAGIAIGETVIEHLVRFCPLPGGGSKFLDVSPCYLLSSQIQHFDLFIQIVAVALCVPYRHAMSPPELPADAPVSEVV